MYQYPTKRTPEQGHTKHCLAKALIDSIENWRDADIDDHEFRTCAQRNDWLADADEWLAIGMTECICPDVPAPMRFVPEPMCWQAD